MPMNKESQSLLEILRQATSFMRFALATSKQFESGNKYRKDAIVPLENVRASKWFLKSVAAIVVITFSTMIMTPTVLAVQNQVQDHQQQTNYGKTQVSHAGEIGNLLQEIKDTVSKAHRLQKEYMHNSFSLEADIDNALDGGKFIVKKETKAEIEAILALNERVSSLNESILIEFERAKARLDALGSPDVLYQRLADAKEKNAAQYAEYQALINELKNATSDEESWTALQGVHDFMEDKQFRKKHQPFDPNNIPNQRPDAANTKKPMTTASAFKEAGYFSTPYLKLASHGVYDYSALTGANDPAYLTEESDEVKVTQAIVDKASELNHHPVSIFEWVRNNVEWTPTWGSVQSAESVLNTQKGNAMDIASLTIGLLRASGIPARYVHGTIDVPAEQYNNWVGDFDDVTVAADHAATGGIPTLRLVSGGQISAVRMEHIWVEAAIDFFPSAGAKNQSADTWLSIDPSFKQYHYDENLDVVGISGLDVADLGQMFTNSGVINEHSATGFNASLVTTAYSQTEQNLRAYFQANPPQPTIYEATRNRTITLENFPVLPSGLPYSVVVSGAKYGQLPNALRQFVKVELFNTALDQVLQSPSLSYQLSFAALDKKKFGLTYRPGNRC